MEIDVTFNFIDDTPCFWNNFWKDDYGIGGGGNDPDSASPTLQTYHSLLWSKPLPNGECMKLSVGNNNYNYLTWKDFRFGSDSILTSFRYTRYRSMLEKVANQTRDYKVFVEDFLKHSCTIGGNIIFPKTNSINRYRGFNRLISNRWDLTLECIRRFYHEQESPLYKVLSKNKGFFDLFVDFKGYVDFFFLQDCVSPDYETVIKWIDNVDFKKNPLPKSVEDYFLWINKQLEFVKKRNERIKKSFLLK